MKACVSKTESFYTLCILYNCHLHKNGGLCIHDTLFLYTIYNCHLHKTEGLFIQDTAFLYTIQLPNSTKKEGLHAQGTVFCTLYNFQLQRMNCLSLPATKNELFVPMTALYVQLPITKNEVPLIQRRACYLVQL